MKKYFVAMAMMLSASLSSFAEPAVSVKSSNAGGDYDKLYASFVFGGANVGGFGLFSDYDAAGYFGNVDCFGMIGANVGYAHAFRLTSSVPLFLEAGGELNYISGTEAGVAYGQYVDFNVKMLNIQIPVNVTYHIPATDKFAIAPYLGVNLKVNAIGTFKFNDGDAYSLFSSKDMNNVFGLGDAANRVQVGMNLGVNFILSEKFTFGYRFQQDFNNYYKVKYRGCGVKLSTNNQYITLGYIL